MVSVVIVDDDALVRAGLSMILGGMPDIRVVGQAYDGADVPALIDACRPDVVLMDIQMPRIDGLTATRALRNRTDAPEVIVLTTFGHEQYVLAALRAGACGFILKDTPPGEIVRAVRAAADGDPILSPDVTRQIIARATRTAPDERRATALALLDQLSDREREVAFAIGQGLSNAEISAALYMSVATVKANVTRILTKLGVNNRVQIALIAHDAALPPPR